MTNNSADMLSKNQLNEFQHERKILENSALLPGFFINSKSGLCLVYPVKCFLFLFRFDYGELKRVCGKIGRYFELDQ